MKRFGLCLAIPAAYFFVLSVAPSTLSAGTPLTYTENDRPLFTISVPDFWAVRTGGVRLLEDPETGEVGETGRILGLSPEAEGESIVGFVSPAGVSDLQGGIEYLDYIGPFLVKDAKATEPVERRVGGMPAVSFSGDGTRNGRRVNFTALVVDLPKGRVVVAVVVIEATVAPELVGQMNELLGSIRVAR